ncbi:oocyte zinc finger protein XlCOF6 [Rhagoletis pomonella]|uniref:oocyte zinc finger protein XlCOF6 n=1 Tax=Rhagoletis pomonella TaxID=28610 RepID=UPI0017853C57|nr:oocyte zinc finger protein XlCOF6 [Rhagoletis pomonella]XP_036321921.1 oocyte zinc finger protein XlCOF6 [Rhagoletis pomonella]
MAGNGDIMEGIEPCRTCGIFYLTSSNFLRQIYDSSSDECDLSNIRTELAGWNVEIKKNDGLPQYICTCCILEFQKLFKFRGLCVELDAQWKHFYNLREDNKVYIKKELPDPEEKSETICDFIYVDDLSENEYNGVGGGGFTPFNIPHVPIVPIKEELVEESSVHKDSFVPSLKETFNIPSLEEQFNIPSLEEQFNIQMEVSEEANQTHDISYLTSSNLNILNSPEPQPLEEHISENSSIHVKQEASTSVQCSLCRHISATMELHRQHMQRIHEIKDMVCHICGKQFTNSTATRLKFHLKWHRISKHIKCAQCGFFCDSRETLKEHTRAIHSKIECTTCGKRVLGKKMKVHMRTHELRSWPCSYCDEVFQMEDILESHIWQIHAKEETLPTTTVELENAQKNSLTEEQHLSCDQCDRRCSTEHELKAHKLQCSLIQNTTDTEACANTDIQDEQFHYQDSTEVLQMPITNLQTSSQNTGVNEENSYSSKNNNSMTQVISSDEETCESEKNSRALEEFTCPKCTQTFSSTETLCSHYEIHLEKPGFSCHICGKSFELKFTLNRHLKKHKSPYSH